ncbi:MAG TPA: cation diffusion facilitator family transporter [Rudaea sp.]
MSHSHAHSHAPAENRLLLAFALTVATLVGEAVGGWISGSLALLSDAAHMLIDACALLLAWGGAHFSRRPADALRSFGYARLEVLVGYTNALAQFGLTVWIVVEAVLRLRVPEPILSGLMLAVAAGGLVVNAFVLRVLGGHSHDDLNVAGARLHVIGDLLGSFGAVVAALAIGRFGWLWADPAISILVALLILGSAWKLLRRSAHILLEGTPEGLESADVAAVVKGESGVDDVHHVHVWQLAGGMRIATLHARLADGTDAGIALRAMQQVLRERFHIEHATIQLETAPCLTDDCRDAAHTHRHAAHAHHHHNH